MLDHLTTPILKRAIESTSETTLPRWFWIVFGVEFLILLPIFFLVSYTVKQIFPALAIIEDENPPPAYQPVSLNDDVSSPSHNAECEAGDEVDTTVNKNPNDPLLADQAVTSSLRGTYRLLKSHGGYSAFFRGLACIIVSGIAQSIICVPLARLVGPLAAPAATLLSMFLTCQLWTAWLHIVITPRSPLYFWKRLPPFRRTFVATYIPILIYVAAKYVSVKSVYLVAALFGVVIPDLSAPQEEWNGYYGNSKASWVAVPVFLVSTLTYFLLNIPALVVVVRVQASLLPPEQHTIVPFDRSFGGRVDPTVAGGKPYATIKDAVQSFGYASWKRVYKLCMKIFLLECLVVFGSLAIFIPQVIVARKFSQPNDSTGEEL